MGKEKNRAKPYLISLAVILLTVLVVFGGVKIYQSKLAGKDPESPQNTVEAGADADGTTDSEQTMQTYNVDNFNPHAVDSTKPERLVSSTAVSVDGKIVESYNSPYKIKFYEGTKYTDVEGIITFRGDNFRSGAAFGRASVSEKKLNTVWTNQTGSLRDAGGTFWSGNGWSGQPLITKWPDAMRRNFTAMHDWARQKDGLVEVIYASMDGYIHFYELETGEETRDPMNIGFTFKGAGALDPRGYPIMYVGSGVNSTQGRSRVFIINLVDNTIMYQFGQDESFCDRYWNGFDSSALVCAETDQLIYPGENGILYIMKLNTRFDENTGSLSVAPDNIVKWKYMGTRTGDKYWLGMEDSSIIINHYMIIADNGGLLLCLDLNTLKLVWAQDILDDTNCTPVLSIEDGHPYVYTSTSLHYGWRSTTTAAIPIWKIDAETGEIVWRTDYTCQTMEDLSGGVQGTLAVGKNKLSELIFVPIARTPDFETGTLVALYKKDGKTAWEKQTDVYSWSSPVDFYDEDGNGYIIHCNTGANMYLLDGLTGEELDRVSLGSNVEASPSMYNGYAVVGTRGQKVFCMKVK